MTVVDLNRVRLLNMIEEQSGLNIENSNINDAINEAIERSKLYDILEKREEKRLEEIGVTKTQCFNAVCKDNICADCNEDGGSAVGCMYRMVQPPPNSLNYKDYMPTHLEALDMLEKHNLLKGDRQEYIEANSRYGKPNTQNERLNTEIKEINFHILKQCYYNALKTSQYEDTEDWEVLIQNLCVEIEKSMGIYPNIVRLI
jgi:hypothetical protein